ncbi:MAG: hypothetical protein RL489_189 [Pseudomonadota bacterium]|jgi:murein L,D-transpeptidase YcbB/YkuD
MPATLHQGSTGFDVAVLQLQLTLKNATARPLRVDGGFGPLTRAALVAFQSRNGLAADGIAGPKTHAALAQGLNLSAVHHAMMHIAQPTQTTCWAAEYRDDDAFDRGGGAGKDACGDGRK